MLLRVRCGHNVNDALAALDKALHELGHAVVPAGLRGHNVKTKAFLQRVVHVLNHGNEFVDVEATPTMCRAVVHPHDLLEDRGVRHVDAELDEALPQLIYRELPVVLRVHRLEHLSQRLVVDHALQHHITHQVPHRRVLAEGERSGAAARELRIHDDVLHETVLQRRVYNLHTLGELIGGDCVLLTVQLYPRCGLFLADAGTDHPEGDSELTRAQPPAAVGVQRAEDVPEVAVCSHESVHEKDVELVDAEVCCRGSGGGGSDLLRIPLRLPLAPALYRTVHLRTMMVVVERLRSHIPNQPLAQPQTARVRLRGGSWEHRDVFLECLHFLQGAVAAGDDVALLLRGARVLLGHVEVERLPCSVHQHGERWCGGHVLSREKYFK
eukprot:PhM_4_TR9481/c0_g1_i1/m.82657